MLIKPLPPLGQYLAKQISHGTQDVAIVFMGNAAKERAESFQDHLPYTCYLPTGTNPNRYQWPVMGCWVRLLDTSNSSNAFVKTCVLCLLEYGATRVDYFSANQPNKAKPHSIFQRELKNV